MNMSKQNVSMERIIYENKILKLEKEYYEKLLKVVKSDEFTNDLLMIEKEIRENYAEFRDIWDIKNKLKVPAERLTRHHVYKQWGDLIEGIYPSPVSSDIGIKTSDAVICIDLKTIDIDGNSGDIKSTAVESNQTSFNNKDYPYIKTLSNLKSIDHYSRLPVLTYIVKIIYNDDGYSFSLARHNKYPTLVTACIPNGEISKLFNYNIITNFKTYKYYSEKEGIYYKPIEIPKAITKEAEEEFIDNICIRERNFSKIQIKASSRGKKTAYFDASKQTLWWRTTINRKKVVAAIKCGGTARFSNQILEERYDDKNNRWIGYTEFKIEKVLQ